MRHVIGSQRCKEKKERKRTRHGSSAERFSSSLHSWVKENERNISCILCLTHGNAKDENDIVEERAIDG